MRFLTPAVACAALIAAVSCQSGAPALDPAREAAIAAEIRAAFDEYTRSLNDGDFGRALQFYADDRRFRWVEDGEVRYRSRDEVAKGFAQLADLGAATFEHAPPEIVVLGPDSAILLTSHTTTLGVDRLLPVSFSGAITITLVRTRSGWRFLSGHTSTARPTS